MQTMFLGQLFVPKKKTRWQQLAPAARTLLNLKDILPIVLKKVAPKQQHSDTTPTQRRKANINRSTSSRTDSLRVVRNAALDQRSVKGGLPNHGGRRRPRGGPAAPRGGCHARKDLHGLQKHAHGDNHARGGGQRHHRERQGAAAIIPCNMAQCHAPHNKTMPTAHNCAAGTDLRTMAPHMPTCVPQSPS